MMPRKQCKKKREGAAPPMLYNFFRQVCLFRSSHTVCNIIVAYESRLTDNGIPPEPNLIKPAQSILAENLFHPDLSSTTKYALCLHPVKL